MTWVGIKLGKECVKINIILDYCPCKVWHKNSTLSINFPIRWWCRHIYWQNMDYNFIYHKNLLCWILCFNFVIEKIIIIAWKYFIKKSKLNGIILLHTSVDRRLKKEIGIIIWIDYKYKLPIIPCNFSAFFL